mmetsp:Transcript_105807/g.207527  ORF Transcript_105807/g.207527 Transcript_105807/m.207527 type:complete len:255 (+) Transcript_105807:411-1175(+)
MQLALLPRTAPGRPLVPAGESRLVMILFFGLLACRSLERSESALCAASCGSELGVMGETKPKHQPWLSPTVQQVGEDTARASNRGSRATGGATMAGAAAKLSVASRVGFSRTASSSKSMIWICGRAPSPGSLFPDDGVVPSFGAVVSAPCVSSPSSAGMVRIPHLLPAGLLGPGDVLREKPPSPAGDSGGKWLHDACKERSPSSWRKSRPCRLAHSGRWISAMLAVPEARELLDMRSCMKMTHIPATTMSTLKK